MSEDTTTQSASTELNIPTPIMAGVRTPIRQFASCVLVDSDDTLDSIFSSDMAIGKYVAQRAGIGINAGRNQRNQQQNPRRRSTTHRCGPLPQKV